MDVSDESAVAYARIARAFDSLLNAAMARLRLHYAARISGLMLTRQGGQSAAVAALMAERDAALAQLRREMVESRRAAIHGARRQGRRKRYRVVVEPEWFDVPSRPTRTNRKRWPVRAMSGKGYPKP